MEKSNCFFHTMENFFVIFPHYGKKFSILWKIGDPTGLAEGLIYTYFRFYENGLALFSILAR